MKRFTQIVNVINKSGDKNKLHVFNFDNYNKNCRRQILLYLAIYEHFYVRMDSLKVTTKAILKCL